MPRTYKREVFSEDPELAPVEEPIKATVKLLNTDLHDGCYLVYNVNRKDDVFLVPKEHLRWSVAEQEIEESILEACVRPYGWEDEIREILPSVQDVRLAILRNGLLSKADLADKNKAANALYGAFPNRLPFKGEI